MLNFSVSAAIWVYNSRFSFLAPSSVSFLSSFCFLPLPYYSCQFSLFTFQQHFKRRHSTDDFDECRDGTWETLSLDTMSSTVIEVLIVASVSVTFSSWSTHCDILVLNSSTDFRDPFQHPFQTIKFRQHHLFQSVLCMLSWTNCPFLLQHFHHYMDHSLNQLSVFFLAMTPIGTSRLPQLFQPLNEGSVNNSLQNVHLNNSKNAFVNAYDFHLKLTHHY